MENRQELSKVIFFLSRISGFPLPIFFVYVIGTSSDSNYVYVTIAIVSAAASLASSLVEVHSLRILTSEGLKKLNQLILNATALGTCIGVVLSLIILFMYKDFLTYPILFVFIWVPLGNAIQGLINAKAIIHDSYKIASILNLSRTILMIFVVFFGKTPDWIFLGMFISELPRLVYLAFSKLNSRYTKSEIRFDILKSALIQTPSSTVSLLNPVVHRIAVERFSLGSVGFIEIAEKSIGFFNLIFSLGILPNLTSKLLSTNRANEYLHIKSKLLTVCILIFIVSSIFIMGFILLGSISNEFQTVLILICLYTFAMYPTNLLQLNTRVLVLNNAVGDVNKVTTVFFLVNAISVMILLHFIGIFAVPISSLISLLVANFVSKRKYLWRYLGE